MANEGDQSMAVDAVYMRAALSHREPVMDSKGKCFNCDEPLPQGLYCDADCRDDHEKLTRNVRR